VKANIDDLPSADEIKATSDCGDVAIKIIDKNFSGGCAGTLMREFLATDDCGNKASTTQFIKLIDTSAPNFMGASEIVYAGKDGSLAPKSLEVVDNSNVKIQATFSDQERKGYIIRTWTAEDYCGNTTSFVQKLLLQEEIQQ